MSAAANTYDVIVIGTGVMGASACWQLARRGVRVLGLDRYGAPNTQGSSHGLSRVFRTVYFEHADYVPLLQRALGGWRELEAASGAELLTLSGGLYMGSSETAVYAQTLAAAELHGLEHELVDSAALSARWPQFNLPGDFVGVYEAPAGIVKVEDSIEIMAQLARAAGGALQREQVLDWTATAGGVTVSTALETYHARTLIICPGAFAGDLIKTDAFKITPTRQVVAWFEVLHPERAGTDRFPVWAAERSDGKLFYGMAALPGSPGLKLGTHTPGPAVDPETESRSATLEEVADLEAFAHEWLPHDAGRLTSTSVCLYEMSADGHFILDRHPEHENVLLFCGGSGHGFKFGPVIGEIWRTLQREGEPTTPSSFSG